MPPLGQRLLKLRDPEVRRWVRRSAPQLARAAARGWRGAFLQRGVRISGPGTVVLHPGSRVRRDARIHVADGARLELHPGAVIGTRALINVETALTIGRGCELSWDVEIMDTDFHDITGPDGDVRAHTCPVVLGEHVLVGAGATILKGVTIGDGAVVAARAVVTKDVPAGVVVAGNPARVVSQVAAWH